MFRTRGKAIENNIAQLLKNQDRRSFGSHNKIFFFKELGYLLQGGVWIRKAIQLIHDNTSNFALKEITEDIHTHISQWKALSFAIARQWRYFSLSDRAIIRSGESGWNLIITLQSLAQEYQFLHKIYNQYKGALIYPITLICIALIAIVSLFAFVLPGIFTITEQFENISLPRTTRLLQSISDFIVHQRHILLGFFLWLFFIGAIFFSTKQGSIIMYRTILQLPVIGTITQYYYLIKWCRYMKLMTIAGMSYVQTTKILQDIMAMPLYENMLQDIHKSLHTGGQIYDVLQYQTELIPSSATALIKVWEETASMPESLENIIAIYQEDMKNTITNLSKIIEPVMLVFIGGIIIVIALWVFGIINTIMDGMQI